ncbi:MAG: protein-(glutamine-N5) methyltransferase, release factor-specific [Rhodopirellula sp.]|nr:protein-(glutamine-N5) methyltransferase, release factor-specific [Rhodopirellula sp.]
MSESQDQPWTVLRLLDWTTEFFKRKGSESPRLDAEVLLAHARECERIELYTAFAEEPGEEQRVAFREMVRRRGEGMPVAQLVGYREFYSSRFRVSDATLIPRPETEHLVVETLDCAKQFSLDRPLQVIDVGTGSGVIAISVAQSCANAVVTAVDISEAALKIAAWNAQKLEVADRIEFMQSDLLSAVEQPECFDVICSNPPYVSEAEYKELSPTVRDFEPQGALVSGPDGTEVIARLLEQAPDRLNIGGRLIIELSPMIADACQALALANPAFGDLRFIKDLDGHRRILSLQRI